MSGTDGDPSFVQDIPAIVIVIIKASRIVYVFIYFNLYLLNEKVFKEVACIVIYI